MATKLSPHFLDLVADAALKSFWRKRALHTFLRRVGISEKFLATWLESESKRDLLYRMFPVLENAERGPEVIAQMARALAEQTSFPDLENWEDAKLKKQQAAEAVKALKNYVEKERVAVADAKEQSAARARAAQLRAESTRRSADLNGLQSRLDALAAQLGTQQAGYAFQGWFYDLVSFFEVLHRKPYVTGGRQIDGTITVDGTTYLVELKFTSEPAGSTDVDSLYKKVRDKADNTMGILVSVSGFSSTAISEASVAGTTLLLVDHGHLYRVLGGHLTIDELVTRVRRHASQTGSAFIAAADL
jgi:hypothetical protein